MWTEDADQTIKEMRAAGATWSSIGACLGLSRNTVIERGRRLCAVAPVRLATSILSRNSLDDPNRDALPAGHPLTWGLICNEAFPEPQTVKPLGRLNDKHASPQAA
jgi:hypothetical protein